VTSRSNQSIRVDHHRTRIFPRSKTASPLPKAVLMGAEYASSFIRQTEPDLVVEGGGIAFRAGGTTVTLGQRKQLARVLLALADAHLTQPGEWISTPRLIDTAWQGERMQKTSAKNRLHVAISTLRKLGLLAVLQSKRGAYRLREDARVVVAPNLPRAPRLPVSLIQVPPEGPVSGPADRPEVYRKASF
jgi:hypothetical protein